MANNWDLFIFMLTALSGLSYVENVSECVFPASWQQGWWLEYDTIDEADFVYFSFYRESLENTYRDQVTGMIATISVLDSLICLEMTEEAPYVYYVRHPEGDDAHHECVRVYMNDKVPQLMVHTILKSVVWSCDFDYSAELCGMIPDNSSYVAWISQHGETPTADTGPSADYSGFGRYIYMETDGSSPQATSRIDSPPLHYVGDICVQFVYHMYGPDVGSLVVYTVLRGQRSSDLWQRQGEQSQQWVQGELDVTLGDEHEGVGFEGFQGMGSRGNIALDEITIKSGKCDASLNATVPSCLERGFDWPVPAQVLVQRPINYFLARCPFDKGNYHVSVSTVSMRDACVDVKDSIILIEGGAMIIQSCLPQDSYREPFSASLACIGEVPTDVIGSTEDNGKLLILAYVVKHPSFYTARYKVGANRTIYMSLHGNAKKLQPRPEQRYDTVVNDEPEFAVAFKLQRYETCEEIYCGEHGECSDTETGFLCVCQTPYYGRLCESYNDCPVGVCGDHGQCKDLEEDYFCDCDDGYHGERCESVDYCPAGQCGEHGECMEDSTAVSGYMCKCDTRYYGPHCENYDDCPPGELCSEHGVCKDLEDDYYCRCLAPIFYGEICENIHYPSFIVWGYDEDAFLVHDDFAEGSNITAECTYNVIPPQYMKIYVHYGRQSVACSDVQDTGTDYYSCRAHVVVSRQHNGAQWWCRGEYWHENFLSDKESISITFPASRVELTNPFPEVAQLKTGVSLQCETDSSNPLVSIQWRRNGVVIRPNHIYTVMTLAGPVREFGARYVMSTLSFIVTLDQYEQTFDCIVPSQSPVLYSLPTTLKGSLVVSIASSGGAEYPGDGYTLTCNLSEGEDTAEFVWTFIHDNSNASHVISRDKIVTKERFTESDVGVYKCSAVTESSAGSDTIRLDSSPGTVSTTVPHTESSTTSSHVSSTPSSPMASTTSSPVASTPSSPVASTPSSPVASTLSGSSPASHTTTPLSTKTISSSTGSSSALETSTSGPSSSISPGTPSSTVPSTGSTTRANTSSNTQPSTESSVTTSTESSVTTSTESSVTNSTESSITISLESSTVSNTGEDRTTLNILTTTAESNVAGPQAQSGGAADTGTILAIIGGIVVAVLIVAVAAAILCKKRKKMSRSDPDVKALWKSDEAAVQET